MATYYWVGGNGTWSGTGNTQFAITSGGVPTALNPTNADIVNFDANSGTAATVTVTSTAVSLNTIVNKADINLSLSGSPTLCTSVGTLTLTTGTITLNNNTLTVGLWTSDNSNVRSIAFGTGNITVTGNANFVILMGTMTNFTYTGTPTFNCTYAGSTGTRNIRLGGTAGATESNVMSVNISAGTDIISLGTNLKNLNYTGFAGTISNVTFNIYGNLTYPAGSTISAGSSPLSFLATSGTQLLTTNNNTLDFPITKDGAGTLKLQDNLTAGLSRTFTLTTGTIDLNTNKTLTIGPFTSSNSNVRSILFGTSGKIIVGANTATVWQMSTVINFTYTGTSWVEFNYAGSTGTRTFGFTTGATEANALNIRISAGSDTLSLGGSVYRDLDFTGFSGTVSNSVLTIYGSLTVSSGLTWTAGASAMTFAATSGSKTITTNTKTLDFPITFNGIGGTWICQDAITLGATRALTMINGTVKLKSGTTNTVGSIVTSGTNIKYLASSTPGSQATISDVSGVNSVSYLSIQDSFATGGATWDAFYSNGNLDAGNNTNWEFGESPVLGNEIEYKLRSFTEYRRF